MIASTEWQPFDNGLTVGTRGSEHGIIIRDERYPGARITLERDGYLPFAITCGCCGMAHTCFFRSEQEAQSAFEIMKTALEQLAKLCADSGTINDYDSVVVPAIRRFVKRFA